ncbi:TonB-dependent receptor [Sphingomonas sp. ACRSK]|uniref:TonB-dependent receptor n=1 Tax=Sphingomonas sp. ACRSK TaxID=2918213 RepID=UPI001EF4A1D2|nr:TonB-dependent receptor [Sphingomonas sp. ACRSK]
MPSSLAVILALQTTAPLASTEPPVPAAEAVAAAEVQEAPAAEAAGGEDVVVTARRRAERAQSVPIALSVLGAEQIARTGTFTIQQVSQQAPTLQYTSSNPRNTALNIRGLGVSFGLANDGLEQGVGFYVDQVYNSRPAASAFDLLDIERVEILRGPQGTLFGKNTTAGAVNITTKSPSFTPEGEFEASVGTQKFGQIKAAVTGPISETLAFRVAAGKTTRDGFVRSTLTGRNVNDLDNFAVRGQLLWQPNDDVRVRLIADYNLSDADCCTQVYAGYGETLRPASRQFPALSAALGYRPPSLDPYDRLADADGKLKARSEIGGISAIADVDLGSSTLTSVSAYRWWDWQPANDRDYTALDILPQSANPVQQDQLSQEIRLASNGQNRLDYTLGLYAYYQELRGQNVTEWGSDAAFWLLGTQTANGTAIPSNLLDGYITTSSALSTIQSYAAFAQVTWHITDTLRLTPGLRYTYEHKTADYEAVVSGGLQTNDPALQAAKLSIFRPQAYDVKFSDDALTGDINLSWQARPNLLAYASYARGFKSGGINLAGLPFNATNNPALDRAIVSPEKSQSYEVGIKSQWFGRKLTANFALFRTDVDDFQANVVDTGPGALRGYLANIDSVRSQGAELDLVLAPVSGLSAYLRTAFTDADYVSFDNAPCPLELIASGTTVCDLSGKDLPGTSRWAFSYGAEYRRPTGLNGDAYIGIEGQSRTGYFADASDSKYLRIDGYTTINLRVGFAADAGWEVFGLVRNLFDKDYMTLLTPQSGNSGMFSGVPGDPRTAQVTARYRF